MNCCLSVYLGCLHVAMSPPQLSIRAHLLRHRSTLFFLLFHSILLLFCLYVAPMRCRLALLAYNVYV
ncbi:hypothetical protein OAO87_00080 [bacterium]|nr:hypothetical protein [bacterium]